MCNKTDNMIHEILNTRDSFVKSNVNCKIVERGNGSIQSIVLDNLVKIPSKDLQEISITYSIIKNKTLLELSEDVDYNELTELNEALRSYDVLALDRLYRDINHGRYSDVTKVEAFLRGGIEDCERGILNLSGDDKVYLRHICDCYVETGDGILERVQSIKNLLM